jgi:hypothetical protein
MSRTLHVGLWLVQGLLAVAFASAGFMKATMPIADLAANMPWAGDVPEALVRFIGLSELAGAVGLVLPAALRWKPALTPLAALGLVTIMVLASLFHLSRGEAMVLPVNATLGALAAFVAWGRWFKAPIRQLEPTAT